MLSPPPHTLDNGGGGIVGGEAWSWLAQCSVFMLCSPVSGHRTHQPAGEAHCASSHCPQPCPQQDPIVSQATVGRRDGMRRESRPLLFLCWAEAHAVLWCGLGAMARGLDAPRASYVLELPRTKAILVCRCRELTLFFFWCL